MLKTILRKKKKKRNKNNSSKPQQKSQITNTGQRNHQPNCAVACVLLMTKERAQCMCARCDVGLCMVPCFAEYHTKVN